MKSTYLDLKKKDRTESQRARERRRKASKKFRHALGGVLRCCRNAPCRFPFCTCFYAGAYTERTNERARDIGHHAGRLFAMREEIYDRPHYFSKGDPRHKYVPSHQMRAWRKEFRQWWTKEEDPTFLEILHLLRKNPDVKISTETAGDGTWKINISGVKSGSKTYRPLAVRYGSVD